MSRRCVIIGGAKISRYDLISGYLRPGDFNIYCDCGLKHRQSLGAVPDLIVGDFDSYPVPAELMGMQEEIGTLRPGTLEMCFSGPAEALSVTANTQPCLFAMDYACAAAAREAGVSPDCAAGFSLGEVAAMAFAGVMDFDEAFRFVIKRAEEMQSCAEKHPGAMGAVLRLTPAQVEDICRAFPDRAFPVNYNCPGQTVVACAVDVFDELSAKVTEARGRMLRLNVSGAFHTPWMEKAAEALRAYLANKPTRVPELPLYANATAQPYADDAAHLLSTQVCHPVRWQESVERMAEAGVDTFIEVGAGKTLSGLIRKTIPGAAIFNVEKPEDLQKLSEVRA